MKAAAAPQDQPAPALERVADDRARRDDDRGRHRARSSSCSRPQARRPGLTVEALAREVSLPFGTAARKSAYLDAPDLQHPPLGDRDAALHAAARVARSLAHPRDDPARLLHDEAERHRRDDAGDLARVGEPAPLRAARAGGGLPGDLRRPRADALRRSPASPATSLQPNAGSQGEYAGLLVIRAFHESRAEGAPRRLSDPLVGARHQPGVGGDGRLPRRRRRLRRRRQRRSRRPRRQGERAPRAPGRADGDLPVDARRVRGRHQEGRRDRPRSTAGRSTWTAPT